MSLDLDPEDLTEIKRDIKEIKESLREIQQTLQINDVRKRNQMIRTKQLFPFVPDSFQTTSHHRIIGSTENKPTPL